jgi:hypothetical protein
MAGAPITVDSPWGGTTYNPAALLDITTIESAIVAQLKAGSATLSMSRIFLTSPSITA